VRSIVHTHPEGVSALAMIGRTIEIAHMRHQLTASVMAAYVAGPGPLPAPLR
jgi:hypothetical protein